MIPPENGQNEECDCANDMIWALKVNQHKAMPRGNALDSNRGRSTCFFELRVLYCGGGQKWGPAVTQMS
jgi:hypothetical protein